MEEDKIVLDRRSFEALAVDSRVKILKSLKERRKTLSEIAKEQGMSVSGVKEHLETLEKVGLIEKRDDGHKWKYYELTRKGSDIVAPRELRVWILLSISMVALVASMVAIFSPPQLAADALAPEAPAPEAPLLAMNAETAAPAEADAAGAVPAPEAAGAAEPAEGLRAMAVEKTTRDAEAGGEEAASEPAGPDMTVPVAVSAVSALTLFACAAVLIRNRMKPISL
ncbi:MAG: winged helix-turn-helix domain-containing protein [Candidatus Micrarchaeota archaeon]